MTNMPDPVELFDRVSASLPGGLLGTAPPTRVRGTIRSVVIPTGDELARLLAGFALLDGWAMYQSRLVVELQSVPKPALGEAGRLIAAEWRSAEDCSVSIRLADRGAYRLTEWRQGGDGQEWFCEELSYRSIDGGQLRYLRLWPLDDAAQNGMRPEFSVFAGRIQRGSDE